MERPRDALPEGTKLAGYIIGRVLGRGGFGVTYFGHDALFPDAKVAIKEFLPSGLAVREAGSLTVHPSGPGYEADFRKALSRFEEEARTLVALRHANVVDVQRYIEANGTAYVVMKYEEGRSLSELLAGGKTLSARELDGIVTPLLDGLEAVHKRNFLHRDIKPGNIYIRAADGSPVLLDFGAARQAMGAERKTSLTEIVTPGYAPFEQYFRKGDQGPWTDIYALGATFYRCISGTAPSEAPERVRRDEMLPARDAGRDRYPGALLAGIDGMLAVDEKRRPQTVREVRTLLAAERVAEAQPVSSSSTLVAPVPKSPPPPPPPKPKPQEWPTANVPPKPRPWPNDDPVPSRPQPRSRAGSMWMLLLLVGAVLVGGYYLVQPKSAAPLHQQRAAQRAGSVTPRPAPRGVGDVFRDCAQCPEVVVIPAGMFTMGSPSHEPGRTAYEGPQREVTIGRSLAIGRFEVTFAEFDACVDDGGCSRRPEQGDYIRPNQAWGRGRQPVINVSWQDAEQYTAWLARKTGKPYRLPSEAEWEYAARAGTTTMFSTGPMITTDLANYDGAFAVVDDNAIWRPAAGKSRARTLPVGSFAVNRFGLHDVHGNVAEIVADCWNERFVGAPRMDELG